MTCPRCAGYCVEECTPEENGLLLQWRCVNCGARRFGFVRAADVVTLCSAITEQKERHA